MASINRTLISASAVLSIFLSSCSHHDKELEKDLNARIDNFAEATMNFCDCVSAEKTDCAESQEVAYKAYDEMNKLYDTESEQNIDPEVYESMMNSATQFRTDYFGCVQALNAAKEQAGDY